MLLVHNCQATFAVPQSALLRSVVGQELSVCTGAFAEYSYVFPGSGLVKVPDAVKDHWASAASCALRSVVHAFERLGPLREPEIVAVQGTGPIGLFSVAMAARSGAAKVIAIGAPADRLEVAKKWGADYT